MAERLLSLDLACVSDVPNKGIWTQAIVVKVVDGDTIHVVILLGNTPLKVSVRILGVDCPESTKAKASCIEEMNAGKAVSNHIKSLIKVRDIVDVKLVSKDKYCRYDGDIRFRRGVDVISLSEYLLSNGYAKIYCGKTKEQWQVLELSIMIGKLTIM